MLHNQTIGFIGGGNMAEGLFGGLCRSGHDPTRIWVSEPDDLRRSKISETYSIRCTADNEAVARSSDVCVLAVKPQVLQLVLTPLSAVLTETKPLLVSVAAGINIASLEKWSGGQCAVVRAMPNTPALVGCGASALVANDRANPADCQVAEEIMSAVGTATWLPKESLMDVVTALSGSGPAYFFLVMDALCKAAQRHGLDAATAHQLCTQTALGAATLARASKESLEQLRINVTSPGGTTEQGIKVLQASGLEAILKEAIDAARNKSVELSEMMGEDT